MTTAPDRVPPRRATPADRRAARERRAMDGRLTALLRASARGRRRLEAATAGTGRPSRGGPPARGLPG